MKRFTAYTLTFALFVFWLWAPPARGQGRSQQPAAKFLRVKDRIPNQYIVVLNDDTPGARVAAIAADLARKHGGTTRFVYTRALKGFSVPHRAGSTPLYRYWDPTLTDHFYSNNFNELGFGAYGWSFEQVECYVSP